MRRCFFLFDRARFFFVLNPFSLYTILAGDIRDVEGREKGGFWFTNQVSSGAERGFLKASTQGGPALPDRCRAGTSCLSKYKANLTIGAVAVM